MTDSFFLSENDAAGPYACLLYRHEDFCIVLKKPGFACESANPGGVRNASFLFLSDYWQDILNKKVYCVNRLDVPVSGAAVLAFSKESTAALSSLFKYPGKVCKTYWAVVEGKVETNTEFQKMSHMLFFDSVKRKSYIADTSAGTHGVKRAELEWRCIGSGDKYSFLEIKLLTGRTHQIRCQLAAAGMHVKGDLKYGARRSDSLPGLRLHARSLRFMRRNIYGEPFAVYAPLPHRDVLWEKFCSCAEYL